MTEVDLTIDVVREKFVKHGARLARLHIHHHLIVPILLVHLCDGFVPLLGRELNGKDFMKDWSERVKSDTGVGLKIKKLWEI